VLHDVELPQPGLIKGVTGGVKDMAQAILLCQNEHQVEETLHGFRRMNKPRPKDTGGGVTKWLQMKKESKGGSGYGGRRWTVIGCCSRKSDEVEII